MRWLWTAKAIQCHILFWTVGAIFISLCLGSKEEMEKSLPGNDWVWLALLLVVGYPLVLFLLWCEQRNAQRNAQREFVRQVVATLTEPEKEKARRVKWRRGSLAAIAAAGGAAIYFGHQGLLINELPADYLGYALLVFAGLGVCRVNIWHGGPIDPRFDPQIQNTTNSETNSDCEGNSNNAG